MVNPKLHRPRSSHSGPSILIWLVAVAGSVGAEPSGAELYKKQCAECHGAKGEGGRKFKKPLEGDLSVAQLTDVIAKTMPESDPGSLNAKDAQTIAAYVHDTFYSAVARERNRPARIELSRLTVKQYRQTLADVVGSFRPTMIWSEQRGLRGEYFSGRRFGGNARVLERTDPQVAFDFGTESPAPGKTEPHEFSIRWNGSILAPDTGVYDFVVRTEHATRLWINDLQRPLIDAWVKSGNDTEYRATIHLIGGRVYPLRLEFSKAKQGVDDSKKQKEKPKSPKASIALLWKRPQQALEVIASRQLSPAGAPESYICSTPFPPDDRSYGWERGTTVSKEWDEATTEAALETAGYVAAHLDDLAGIRTPDRRPRADSGNPADIKLDAKVDGKPESERVAKARQFAQRFAAVAFRRPLDKEIISLVDRQFEIAKDPEIAVKRVVLLALKSPRFLYREVGGEPSAYETAARLSYAIWDSIPDQQLIAAAEKNQLTTKEQIARHAERMLNESRAKTKLREFLMTWLKADHGLDLAKDTAKYPGFDASVIADLRTSLELTLENVLWSEKSDFRELLLGGEMFVNPSLARFYGLPAPAATDFVKVKFDADRRAGVLTHPYLMTSFAHSSESSPIHRGVFLARGVLGQSLRPPPEAVAPLAPDLHPNLTTRERVEMQTKAATCMSCHAIINPLGFTLESFDAVGRYRDKDHGKPVDPTGSYRTRDGKSVAVKGARELAVFLAGSDEAHEAFVEQLFHYLVQQAVRAYGPNARRITKIVRSQRLQYA